MKKNIKKILIANRGEIVSRIIFTCKKLGIKTVAIYTKQDEFSKFVHEADEAYKLSTEGASAYLNQKEIINIAQQSNSDAIIPGYGFLSENYQFVDLVTHNGLTWIGPKTQTIKIMGSKTESRKIAEKINVPIIPGFNLKLNEMEQGKKLGSKIGYPILLKDPLAGGGKAMRVVLNEKEFDSCWQRVASESEKLTSSNQILLEKFIEKGRHVEIQIAGDGKNFIHLYERECSIQRRNQKIIEQTPCEFLDPKILNKMYSAALKIAESTKYDNLGTVEFIVCPDQKFYFLEMNTRLQVEHSITEFTTGLDLVELQIKITQNKKLPIEQKNVSRKNFALECRIYAEDPEQNFAPSTGIINFLKIPDIFFGRIDHNLEQNLEITPFFDPMIAKVTTFGENKMAAIQNMLYVLEQFKIIGIKNNIEFLQLILKTEEMQADQIHTQLLTQKFLDKLFKTTHKTENHDEIIGAIAATLLIPENKKAQTNKTKSSNYWREKQWK
ncbi:MAG: biotin carboxylase N-terminal domain-containing protein [bacterium]